jgi:hypothetical protein
LIFCAIVFFCICYFCFLSASLGRIHGHWGVFAGVGMNMGSIHEAQFIDYDFFGKVATIPPLLLALLIRTCFFLLSASSATLSFATFFPCFCFWFFCFYFISLLLFRDPENIRKSYFFPGALSGEADLIWSAGALGSNSCPLPCFFAL